MKSSRASSPSFCHISYSSIRALSSACAGETLAAGASATTTKVGLCPGGRVVIDYGPSVVAPYIPSPLYILELGLRGTGHPLGLSKPGVYVLFVIEYFATLNKARPS